MNVGSLPSPRFFLPSIFISFLLKKNTPEKRELIFNFGSRQTRNLYSQGQI